MPFYCRRIIAFCMLLLATLACCPACRAQAALLMEEPYGFFGALNPTGHTAIYFARICAETPVKLRRCHADEYGSVIARYQGIAGYDWVAMPLVPYLYSVEDISKAPEHVNRATVLRLRNRYHEAHMGLLGNDVFAGNIVRGGWTQLVGVAFERRIYAFRFNTTEAQDDALIEKLNSHSNQSHFDLLYSNCADFARDVMNTYFPRTFRRTFFPDAGITTPRQITFKLVRYAKKHPELELSVFEIPQVPGYRHLSHVNKSISASLVTTGYAVPLTILNPYVAGAIFMDYLVRGRYPLVPKRVDVLDPGDLSELSTAQPQVEPTADAEPHRAAAENESTKSPGLREPVGDHE